MKQSRETYDVQTLKSHETGIVLEMRNAAGGFSALPTKAGCVDRPSPKLFWGGGTKIITNREIPQREASDSCVGLPLRHRLGHMVASFSYWSRVGRV